MRSLWFAIAPIVATPANIRVMPADGKGAKGGNVMSLTHATGAAAGYGMRYLLKMIFNIAIGEEDTDGNLAAADLPLFAEHMAAIELAPSVQLLRECFSLRSRRLRWRKISSPTSPFPSPTRSARRS